MFRNSFLKTAYLDPVTAAIVGGVRASNLSDDEKRQLRARYGLDSDANLTVRNAGRGIVGGGLGALGGLALGALVPGAGRAAGMTLGSVLGGAAGTHFATNKYSKKNV